MTAGEALRILDAQNEDANSSAEGDELGLLVNLKTWSISQLPQGERRGAENHLYSHSHLRSIQN